MLEIMFFVGLDFDSELYLLMDCGDDLIDDFAVNKAYEFETIED